LGDNFDPRLGKLAGSRDRGRRPKPAQHFERTGEVELRNPREDQEADGEISHAAILFSETAVDRHRSSHRVSPGVHPPASTVGETTPAQAPVRPPSTPPASPPTKEA